MSYYAWQNNPVLRRLLEPKQYASKAFRRLLKAHDIEGSMSRKGDCWDTQCKLPMNAVPI